MRSTVTDVDRTTIATEADTTSGPWSEFGTLQYFEVFFLVLVVITGTLGNLLVILSIVCAKKVHKNGNVFIINLAVADLLVTGFVIPIVIASVIKGGNALDKTGCDVIGVTVTISCTCSIYNLMLIAANRCCFIATPMKYDEIFTRKYENMMVFGIWAWAVVLILPNLFGWGGAVKYEPSGLTCYWSDSEQEWYNVFITLFAVFIPFTLIGLCYARIFYAVVRIRKISLATSPVRNGRSLKREQTLFRTLFTTVVVFTVCWVPFGIDTLIKVSPPQHVRKVFDWLALTNSSVNFIIYGALNSGFRNGYLNVILYIFCYRRERKNNATSTLLRTTHGEPTSTTKRRYVAENPEPSLRSPFSPNTVDVPPEARPESSCNLEAETRTGHQTLLLGYLGGDFVIDRT